MTDSKPMRHAVFASAPEDGSAINLGLVVTVAAATQESTAAA
jgi:hypothetical protein